MSDERSEGATSLLGLGTWIRQGPATLVLRENAWVVLVPGLRKQVTEAAWDVLGRKPAPEDFLDELVEAGELESADKLTALLFGFHDGTTATFGVKGTTPIAVYTAEGSQQVAGTEDEPFVLKTVAGVRRTAFGELPPEEPIGAPRVATGIVPVRGFVHATVDPDTLNPAERAALAEQIQQDGRSIEDPEAAKRRSARPAPKPATTASSEPRRKPSIVTRKSGEMPPSLARGGAPSSSAAPAPAPSGPNMFDGLFSDRAPTAPPPPAAPEPAAVRENPAAVPPAPEAAPEAAPETAPASASAGQRADKPVAGKRRLVSTSLFDRNRRASAAEEPSTAAELAAPPPPSAPGEPALTDEQPTPTAVAPTTAERPVAPSPAPPTSVPTPEPPEDDEFASPPTLIAPIDDDGDAEADEQIAAPVPVKAAPAVARTTPVVGDLENTGAYDDLFGKTVFRRIEDAAVRQAEGEDDEQDPAPTGPAPAPAESPSSPEPEAGERPEPVPAASSSGGEFIDWVPGVGRAAPEIAQTAARRAAAVSAPVPAYPQVHMAERPPAQTTGYAGQQPAARQVPPAHQGGAAMHGHHASAPHPVAPAGPPPAPPTPRPAPAPQPGSGTAASAGRPGPAVGGAVALPGVVCPNGHASSPEREVCRSCGAPLQGETRTVARPPLGAVEVSSGERFLLDRSAVVGRRPRASRVSGHDVPQLITVPSPQQDISRSHLELRLEGWHVVALDLGATNGTTLFREGYEPVRLRPREGVVLHDGDHLDLGDDVHLRFRERV